MNLKQKYYQMILKTSDAKIFKLFLRFKWNSIVNADILVILNCQNGIYQFYSQDMFSEIEKQNV